jgi:hypothetical protein
VNVIVPPAFVPELPASVAEMLLAATSVPTGAVAGASTLRVGLARLESSLLLTVPTPEVVFALLVEGVVEPPDGAGAVGAGAGDPVAGTGGPADPAAPSPTGAEPMFFPPGGPVSPGEAAGVPV